MLPAVEVTQEHLNYQRWDRSLCGRVKISYILEIFVQDNGSVFSERDPKQTMARDPRPTKTIFKKILKFKKEKNEYLGSFFLLLQYPGLKT